MFGKYFYGNEISNYGRKNGRVDYRTFAKAFDAVLNNDIMGKTWGVCGEWEQESGWTDNSEEIEEIREQIEALEEKRNNLYEIETETADEDERISGEIEGIDEEIRTLDDRIDELEDEQNDPAEVFQWYIIDDNGARVCKEFGEIVYYNSELDMYLWGVTHYGTAWDYVLTNIECEKDEDARA